MARDTRYQGLREYSVNDLGHRPVLPRPPSPRTEESNASYFDELNLNNGYKHDLCQPVHWL